MSQPVLKLAFDVVNQALVSYVGSVDRLPPLRQAHYPVRIYLVQPIADAPPNGEQYELYDASGFDGLRIGIWSNSTGIIGDDDAYKLALCSELDLAYVDDGDGNMCFQGTLNTLTDQMADHIDTANSADAYLAVNLVLGGVLTPVFDQQGGTNIKIYSATDGGSGVIPVDMTAAVPMITLPLHIKDPDSGELYAIVRTAPGTLQFTQIG